MRKAASFLFFVILTGIVHSCLGAERKTIILKLEAGPSRFLLGDLNGWLEDTVRYIIEKNRSREYTIPQKFEPFHRGYETRASLLFPLTERLYLILGSGYMQAQKNHNTLSWKSPASFITTTILDHTAKAVPLHLGIRAELPLSPKSRFFIYSTGAFYFAWFSEDGSRKGIRADPPKTTKNTWKVKTSATGLGASAGMGLEFDIAHSLSIFVEGKARLARISGFSGLSLHPSNSGYTEWEEIRLYYYEFVPIKEVYKSLNLPYTERGFSKRILRDAVIDFSGFSLQAGLKISL
jgi:hypothetical protein